MTPDVSSAQLVARPYERLSDKKGGTSLERQAADNTAAAAENAWRLGAAYVDDGLSASRFATKARGDFEQLIADLSDGPTGRESSFGADILMLWESSRGSRRVGEWVNLIELCEAKSVRIWVTTHERLYDPRNGRDRKSLLDDAVDSEYESYKTHRRVASTAAVEASKGRPHGAAPDGLMAVYDEKTGDLVTWIENAERSAPVKKLFELLEAGQTLNRIEGIFKEAGYLNLAGRPFKREHLRDLALRHAYAGLRHHKGAVYDGVWKGIVPVTRFWNVQRILSDPSRRKTRGGRAVHALTAGLWCARCGSGHGVNVRKGRNVYRCQSGCVMIHKESVDDLIIGSESVGRDGTVTRQLGSLLAFLAREDIYALLTASRGDDKSLQDLRGRLARERAEMTKMEKADADTLEEAQVLARSIKKKRAVINDLEEQERQIALPPVLLKLVRPGVDVWDSWSQLPVSAQREVVRIVLSPHLLGRVYIHPSPRTGPGQPILERIEYRRSAA